MVMRRVEYGEFEATETSLGRRLLILLRRVVGAANSKVIEGASLGTLTCCDCVSVKIVGAIDSASMADFEGISIPSSINSPCSSKPLALLGKGIDGTEIHFLQIKFYAIAVYAESEVAAHLQAWKGKPQDALLAEDSGFFTGLCQAPVEKLVKFVIIKEVKGSQFATPLQISVRDRLANADEFEDEEEEALDKLVEFFQKKKPWLSKDTAIYFHWASPKALHVSVVDPSNDQELALAEKGEHSVENEKVARNILDWIVGQKAFCPSLLHSIASNAPTSFE